MADNSTDPATQLTGVMPPPPGHTPDFHGTTDVQRTFIVVFAVLWGISTVTLMMRLYTRAILVKSIGWDEPLLIASWAVTFVFCFYSIKVFPYGFGRHLWDVTPVQLGGYLENLLILALTYLWPPTLTKLSILLLYWRISPEKWLRAAILATAFALLSYTITFTVLFSAPCNPSLGTPESAVCLNNIAVAHAVLNIISDAVIIVLPIPTIHGLHMPLKQKVTVGLILGLGSAACIASIVRVAYVRAMTNNPDVTFTQASAAIWSTCEMTLGIICNCLAVMKPFARRHMPWLFTMTGSNGGGGATTDPASYAKRSKSGGRWGHSYQLHSVGKGKMDDNMRDRDDSDGAVSSSIGGGNKMNRDDIVVVEQFRIEYDQRTTDGTLRSDGKGDSTDSILKLSAQYPAHRPV